MDTHYKYILTAFLLCFLAAMGTIDITINLWCLTSLARDWSENEDTHCIHTCTKYTHTCPEFIQYLWQERLKDIWEVIESGPRLVDHVKAHCPRHLVNIWVVHLNIEQNIRSMLDASLSEFPCQIAVVLLSGKIVEFLFHTNGKLFVKLESSRPVSV